MPTSTARRSLGSLYRYRRLTLPFLSKEFAPPTAVLAMSPRHKAFKLCQAAERRRKKSMQIASHAF